MTAALVNPNCLMLESILFHNLSKQSIYHCLPGTATGRPQSLKTETSVGGCLLITNLVEVFGWRGLTAFVYNCRYLTRCLAELVERRFVSDMAIFANHCDDRYSLPHPLIRFIQTSPTNRLSDPSRLQRTAPSVPLNVQSQSLLTIGTRPILQNNSRSLSTTDSIND